MLILHSRRNTTYQCTEITDIIHGVFNSGCSLFMWSGVHGLDECPVIHLLGTCARVLSTDSSPCECVLWNSQEIILKCTRYLCGQDAYILLWACTQSVWWWTLHNANFQASWSKKSPVFGKFVPRKALMQGISVPKSWAEHLKLLVAIIGAVQVPSSLSADPMPTSTTYAAPKNCLMFASKSPLAYLSVCYCLSWSAVAALFRHFLKLTCELQMCQNNINIYM